MKCIIKQCKFLPQGPLQDMVSQSDSTAGSILYFHILNKVTINDDLQYIVPGDYWWLLGLWSFGLVAQLLNPSLVRYDSRLWKQLITDQLSLCIIKE